MTPITIELVGGPCDGRRMPAPPKLRADIYVLMRDDTWARYVSQDELREGALIYCYTPEEAAAA